MPPAPPHAGVPFAAQGAEPDRLADIVHTLSPEPASPSRRGARNGTPGRCANLDYCSIGMQRVLVNVPVGQPFICPECGGRLRPPAEAGGGRPWVMPALRILVLLVGIFLGGVQGYIVGRMQPAARPVVSQASKDAEARVNTARAMLGLKQLAPGAAADMAPPQAASPPEAAPMPAVATVQPRAYPLRTLPLELADPAQHLQKEQRAGQVTVDCMLVAGSFKPSCRVGDIRGTDAFSAASLAWLRTLAVQYAPDPRDAGKPAQDHRWRIIFEDFSGLPPAAKPSTPRRL